MLTTWNLDLGKDANAALETIAIIFPVAMLTYMVTYVRMQNIGRNFKMYFIEFFVLVVPMVFSETVLVGTIFVWIFYLALVVVCVLVTIYSMRWSKRAKRKFNNAQHHTNKQVTFITNARAAISLLTAIAILAVDFKKIFRPRLGKTREYGFSLMDVGVGLFIYANGVVAPKRDESLLKVIKSSLIIFAAGAVRYLLVQVAKYNVAVWEYGRHWNFFFTLGTTRVFSSLLIKLFGDRHLFIIAPLLLALHEFLLQFGLADFVFAHLDRKTNFIVANREGIISSLGYLGLYLLSVPIGRMLRNTPKTYKMILLLMALATATYSLNYHFRTSRTLANSAYCCWTLFVGVFMTYALHACEFMHRKYTGCKYIPPSLLLEAINYNGLPFFLICNVITGVINMMCETRLIPPISALLTLCSYMFVSCAFALLLLLKKWRLKF